MFNLREKRSKERRKEREAVESLVLDLVKFLKKFRKIAETKCWLINVNLKAPSLQVLAAIEPPRNK